MNRSISINITADRRGDIKHDGRIGAMNVLSAQISILVGKVVNNLSNRWSVVE